MARIRSIKPEFFKHLELQELENEYRGQYVMFVYAGLWTQCDKNGVFFCNAKVLKNEILPYVDFDMQKSLDILEKRGYFIKYSVNGRDYGFVQNFSKYQFCSANEKKQPAKYPEPPEIIARLETFLSTSQDVPKHIEEQTDGVPKHHTEPTGLQDKGLQDKGKRNGSFSESGFNYIPEKTQEAIEDATTLFNKARNFWNELKIPPNCRDIIIPHTQNDVLRTFQNYTYAEIENAIKNYHDHKTKCDNDWKPPPPYGSLYGFLKTGVERYYDDKAFRQQFYTEPIKNENTNYSVPSFEQTEKILEEQKESEMNTDCGFSLKKAYEESLRQNK